MALTSWRFIKKKNNGISVKVGHWWILSGNRPQFDNFTLKWEQFQSKPTGTGTQMIQFLVPGTYMRLMQNCKLSVAIPATQRAHQSLRF